MKKLLFLALLGICTISCTTNSDSQGKLEKLLIELTKENPEEMEKHKKLIEKNDIGYPIELEDNNTSIFFQKGYIGDTNTLYEFDYYNNQIHKDSKGLTIRNVSNPANDVVAKEIETEKFNPESGYIVISVRKNGNLEAIIKGYAYGEHWDSRFNGIIYTKDNEIPFAFKGNKAYLGL